MKNNLLIISTAIVFANCGIDQNDYLEYLHNPENGLLKSITIEGNTYKMMYHPKDLLVAKEISRSSKSKASLMNEFGNHDYFLFEVAKDSKNTDAKSNFYYAYQFEKDIYQLIEGDTIRPSLYLLEQGIQGSQQMRINLSFPSQKSNREILVNDKYGSQPNFVFLAEDITNIPKLKI